MGTKTVTTEEFEYDEDGYLTRKVITVIVTEESKTEAPKKDYGFPWTGTYTGGKGPYIYNGPVNPTQWTNYVNDQVKKVVEKLDKLGEAE